MVETIKLSRTHVAAHDHEQNIAKLVRLRGRGGQ